MSERANPFENLFGNWPGAELLSSAKTVPAFRKAVEAAHLVIENKTPELTTDTDTSVETEHGPVPVRVYTPHHPDPSGPALIFFHGGGFVFCSVETHDGVCRRLAAVSGVRVVSVDYRLAPEHPFPAALDDALGAFDAIADGGLADHGVDRTHLGVGGDSAGANLSAVVAQERRGKVAFQLLLYPLMQLAQIKKPNPKWNDLPWVGAATVGEIARHYLQGHDPNDIRVSPLFAEDLGGVAPAYVLLSELDPLTDEGQAYADRLAASGVAVETRLHKNVPHGFLNATRILPQATAAIEHAGKAMARALQAD